MDPIRLDQVDTRADQPTRVREEQVDTRADQPTRVMEEQVDIRADQPTRVREVETLRMDIRAVDLAAMELDRTVRWAPRDNRDTPVVVLAIVQLETMDTTKLVTVRLVQTTRTTITTTAIM